MSEYGSLVEREIQRFGPASFSLEDLHRRRERKQRNQRIAAGVTALAIIGAVAGGLGWALTRGGETAGVVRPAGPGAQAPTFAPDDLEAVVLGPEDAPGNTRHKQTISGQTALSGPLRSGRLRVSDLAGSGTGFVDARDAEFLEGAIGDADAVFFGSAVVLYDDANGAVRAYRLLVDDFAGRGEGATREAIPGLGEEAAVVRGVGLLGDAPPARDTVYIWRIGNLVLIAAGGPSVEDDVLAMAEEMDSRAAARA